MTTLTQSVLISSLLGIISKPGVIYLDIEDLENFFKKASAFSFGISEKAGKDRALKAVQEAISSLKNTETLNILVIISAKEDIELAEYCEVCRVAQLNKDTNLKCGIVRDDSLGDKMRVVVLGCDSTDVEL